MIASTDTPAAPAGTAWSPALGTRWLFAATAGVELFSVVTGWSKLASLGWVHVRPSTVPAALVLAALWRDHRLAGGRRWLPFYVTAVVAVALPVAVFLPVYGGVDGVLGFAVAAFQEEVVFRVALPLTVAGALRWSGWSAGSSRLGGILSAAVVFCVMPNHLQQAGGGLVGILPFFLLSVFFGLAMRRPDVLVPAALAHLAFNLLSVAVLYGGMSPTVRALGVTGLLGLFVASVHLASGPARQALRWAGQAARGAQEAGAAAGLLPAPDTAA